MKKSALTIMLLTIIAKILGFLRDVTLAYFYGASNISDAYLISITIPAVIFVLIGNGISTSYIPLYSMIVKEKNVQSADRFTSNIINLIIIISTFVIIISLTFIVKVVNLFALGFNGDTLDLAISFTRIGLIGIYFNGLSYLFSGYLNLKMDFFAPAIMGIPFNIFTILAIVFSSKYSINILPIGTVFAMAMQMIFLLPFVYKKGYRYRREPYIKDEYLKRMVLLSLPIILGVSINQINVLVDRTIASQISVGGISALNYANRLNLFIQGIFVMSITTVLYPMISKMASEENINGLKEFLTKAIHFINLLVIPVTIGAMIFSEPIVRLLFARGAFDSQAIKMTTSAIFFYSIGMIGFGLREVLSRAFFSLQDTKTPMINAAISVVINIILNIILSKYIGIGGLALATSISAIVCTALLFISLRKKIGPFGMKNLSISFIKILCASLIMGIIANLSNEALTKYYSENLSMLVSVGVGVVVYFTIIYFLRIDDVDAIINTIKNRIKRNVE